LRKSSTGKEYNQSATTYYSGETLAEAARWYKLNVREMGTAVLTQDLAGFGRSCRIPNLEQSIDMLVKPKSVAISTTTE